MKGIFQFPSDVILLSATAREALDKHKEEVPTAPTAPTTTGLITGGTTGVVAAI